MSKLLELAQCLKECSTNLEGKCAGVEASELSSEFFSTIEGVIGKLQGVARLGGGNTYVFLEAFDKFMAGDLNNYMQSSSALGGEIQTHSELVKKSFQAQRDFLKVVAECKAPSQDVLVKLIQPTSEAISEVIDFKDKNRASKKFNFLSAVAEGIGSLGWVTIMKNPENFARDMAGAAEFYTNRILKDKVPEEKDWTLKLKAMFKGLQKYIIEFFSAGLQWNVQGKDPASAIGSAPAPGPPPPPPVQAPAPGAAPPAGGSESRSALFDEIRKGTAISSGLKHVDDTMKTHKNPNLRSQAPKASSQSPKPYKAPTAKVTSAVKAPVTKKPPVLELLGGKKWVVEYQENNKELKIEPEMKHTIYVFKCTNSVLQVKGKVNSITLDGCKKFALVFDDAVSSLDFINCQSMQAQVTGHVPTINIDKTDGCMVYLSEKSLSTQIITAKSSEMNVLVPKGDAGDYTEYPVPEQFISTYNGKKLVTELHDQVA
ncbi:adenylyl cyclase-associated protein 1-like [Anneissia japonica]|uniref:adenylyl cyclase-associated protein 1-like n=1 Tax=Anneissia japonica TaxID=1529436 RepID=UPI0014256F84|nr:adenylyl cyclase-associated protein 1-like [Anneissia japonica]XP_033108242.1 adenylyl cyclase-associated protein 1-like [Anneissia japonica]